MATVPTLPAHSDLEQLEAIPTAPRQPPWLHYFLVPMGQDGLWPGDVALCGYVVTQRAPGWVRHTGRRCGRCVEAFNARGMTEADFDG